MPCNSEHMEPTFAESLSREICQHIAYLFPLIGKRYPRWVYEGAQEYYGVPERLDEAEQILIRCVKSLSEYQKGRFVYDGRNPKARALANYVDGRMKDLKFKKAQRLRKLRRKKRAEDILSRLRAEEVEILKDYYKRG